MPKRGKKVVAKPLSNDDEARSQISDGEVNEQGIAQEKVVASSSKENGASASASREAAEPAPCMGTAAGSTSAFKVEESAGRLNDISKFCKLASMMKISFSGEDPGSLKSFIRDLEAQFSFQNLNAAERLQAARCLLQGKALAYFKGRIDRCLSYEDLKKELLTRYLNAEEEYSLEERVSNAVMQEGERLTDFITRLLEANSKLLEPFSERRLLQLLLRRMSKAYKLRLCTTVTDFKSIRQLEEAALKADLYFCDDTADKKKKDGPKPKPKVEAAVVQNKAKSSDFSGVVCFRCGDKGHISRNCRRPKKLICYKCKVEGHAQDQCPQSSSSDALIKEIVAKVMQQMAKDGKVADAVTSALESAVTTELCEEEIRINSTSITHDPRPHLAVLLEDKSAIGLIDSGSTHTCVAEWLFNQFKGVRLRRLEMKGKAANGGSLDIIGRAQLRMQLGMTVFSVDCLVVKELSSMLIIGSDFLKCIDARFGFGQRRFRFKDSSTGNWDEVDLLEMAQSERPAVDCVHAMNAIRFDDGTVISDDIPEEALIDYEVARRSWGETDAEALPVLELNHPDISNDDKGLIMNWVKGWFERFASSPGLMKDYEANVYVRENQVPIRCKPFRVAANDIIHVQREVNRLVEENKLVPSDGEWAAPCFTVKKPGTTDRRLVISYVKLNEVVIAQSGGVPMADQIILSLRANRFRSRIDMSSSFHQIKLSEAASKIMQIITPWGGTYAPKVLLMGFKNSTAIFSAALRRVLNPVICAGFAMVFVDDIYVFSNGSLQDHLEKLDAVMSLLRNSDLQLNWKKLKICERSMKVLGHVLEGNTATPCPSKIKAVMNFRAPSNVREVRSLLGTVNFYRKYLPNLSEVLAPLHLLLKKDQQFFWGEKQESALAEVKRLLSSDPMVVLPDLNGNFRVEVDASKEGCGAVLYALNEDGTVIGVVEYFSARFSNAERNMDTSAQEILGLIRALESFDQYLKASPFPIEVLTDHAAIVWLFREEHTNSKLIRYRCRLNRYNLIVRHKKGKENVVPDFLSRTTCVEAGEFQALDFAQSADPHYLNLKVKVLTNPEKYDKFTVQHDVLLKAVNDTPLGQLDWKRVVPADFRQEILEHYHDSNFGAHQGVKRTNFAILKAGYYWPKMAVDVSRYIRQCDKCARCKSSNAGKAGLMKVRTPNTRLFSTVYIDIVGPLPRSKTGHKFILTCLDEASRYLIACPLRSATASAVIKALRANLVFIHGCVELFVSDNGTNFTSKVFKNFCDEVGAVHKTIPVYAPWCNAVERPHRTIKESLRTLCEKQADWGEMLPYVIISINNSLHETMGVAPAQLVFGRTLRTPFNVGSGVLTGDLQPFDPKKHLAWLTEEKKQIWEKVRGTIIKARGKQAERYNLRRRDTRFSQGDLVYVKAHARSSAIDGVAKSLSPVFEGPYVVSRVVSETQYEVQYLDGKLKGLEHVVNLKPFFGKLAE